MDDFIFDLQRFAQETLKISHGDADPKVITFGSDTAKSIKAGSSNDVNVTLNVDVVEADSVTTAAAISLESKEHFFSVTDNAGTRTYSLSSSKDGIVVDIDSVQAMATVGSLDNDENFSVKYSITGDEVSIWKKNYGIFSSSNEVILNSSVSSVVLNNISLDSSNGDIAKVINVSDSAITIASANDFGSSIHSSVLAMDSTSGDVYAQLYRRNNYDNYYRILKGTGDKTLKNISLASDIASSVVYMNFNDPTIAAGGTKFHVDSINNSFILYGASSLSSNKKQVISLSSGATEMTLYDGNLIFSEGQSLTFDDTTSANNDYVFGSYDDTASANDGIIVYSSSDGISSLGDIDAGESFVLTKGDSTATYSMTSIGMFKNGDTVPLAVNGTLLKAGDLSFASLNAADTTGVKYYDATKTGITINSSTGTDSSIFAYGTDALATLVTVANNRYSLGTNLTGDDLELLNLGDWAGVTLESGGSLVLPTTFISESSPLKIAVGTATFGVTSISSGTVTLSQNSLVNNNGTTTIPSDTSIKSVSLFDGTLTGYNGSSQLVVNLTSANDVSVRLRAGNPTLTCFNDGVSDGVSASGGGGYALFIGRGYVSNTAATVDSSGNTKIVNPSTVIPVSILPSLGSTTYDYYTRTAGTVTFIYGKTEGVSVTALNSDSTFTKGSTTYKVTKNNKLISSTNNNQNVKVWKNGESISKNGIYDIDDEYFDECVPAVSNRISIQSSYSSMATGDRLSIIESTSGGISIDNIYGYLVRTSDGYSISSDDKVDGKNLSSIFIDSSVFSANSNVSVVSLDSAFNDVDISIRGSSVKSGSTTSYNYYNFRSTDDDDYAFSLDSASSLVHVLGSSSVSLGSGTLLSDDSLQSIDVGDSYYIIYGGRDDGRTENGITVGVTVSGGNTVRTIGDIEVGESFYIDDVEYTRNNYPLYFTTDDNKFYYLDSVVSGAMTKDSDTVAVNLSDLVDPNNERERIQATQGTYDGNTADILVIGEAESINYVVVDNADTPNALYADLKTHGNYQYQLTVASGAATWSDLDVVSVVGNTASINTSLANNATIVNSSGTAAFKVDSTSGDYFVFSGSDTVPTIQNATALTLFDGTIGTASISSKDYQQAIRLGEKTVTVSATSGRKINYDKDTSLATVEGSTGTAVSVKSSGNINKTLRVIDSSMDFVVDATNQGAVTVTNLDEGDVFYYNDGSNPGGYYSLKPVGLVKSISSGLYLWDDDDVHTLSSNSIEASNLTVDSNWSNIAVVSKDTVTVSSYNSDKIFVDNDYSATYGKLEVSGQNYTLTKGDNDVDYFKAIYLGNSSSVTQLNLSSYFLDKTITSANKSPAASFIPTALTSDASSYQVTISSGVVGLSSVASASLISGSLQADSAIGVSVPVGSNATAYVNPLSDSKVTLISYSTTSSIALANGASFSIEDYDYTYALGNLGLVRTNTQNAITYLNTLSSSNKNTLSLQDVIAEEGDWQTIVAPSDGVFTISSTAIPGKALIVDALPTVGPNRQFGNISLDSSSDGYYLSSVTSAISGVTSVWPDDTTILVAKDVTVTAQSAFGGKKFKGESSGAEFTLTLSSGSTFTVIDQSSGASIGGNTNISQTAGTITTANTNQTIEAGGYQIIYGSGDGINIIAGGDSSPTISALAQDDSFSIGSDKKYTMMSNKRLRTDDYKMLKDTFSGGTVRVSDLATADDWTNFVSVSGGNLTVNSDLIQNTILADNGSAYIIEGNTDDTIYGTLTKTADGYSLTKTGNHNLTSIKLLNTDNLVTLNSAFTKVQSIIADDGTTFKVNNASGSFVLDYTNDGYIQIIDATELSLNSGTIQTSYTDQTIKTSDSSKTYQIYATALTGDSSILVINNNGSVSLSGLDVGDTFKIDSSSKTYKVTNIGVVRDNSLLADDNWDEESRAFAVASGFERMLVATDDNHELDLSTTTKRKPSAIVDDTENPTTIIGEVASLDGGALSITSDNASSITSIYLGQTSGTINTGFDTSVRSASSTRLFVINGDFYQAAGTSLIIQSGTSAGNNSALLYGKVLLNETYSAVNTSLNGISVNGGAITVAANVTSGDSITGLTNGDIFSVDGSDSLYSVKGAGLLNDNKIWKESDLTAGVVIDETSDSGLLNSSNWNYYLAVGETSSVLSIPPSNDFDSTVTSWTILNHNMSGQLGTLNLLSGGYSVALSNWDSNYTLSVDGIEATLPSLVNRKVVKVNAVSASAVFQVSDNTVFTVTDGANTQAGATIGNAENISLTSGTIALPTTGQTVKANVNSSVVTVANGGGGDGIVVIAGDNSASIGALSVDDVQDTFYINKVEYEMLQNGFIKRHKDSKFWLGTIKDNGAVDINSLLTDEDNWISSVTISSGNLTIGSNIPASLSAAYISDKDNASSIYGTLEQSSVGYYNLSSTGSTQSLNSITISETAKSVSLSAGSNKYLNIPIIAGDDATILATKTTGDIFSIDYNNNIWSSDATAISLGGGTWQLSDTTQTLTADGQTVKVGNSTAVSVTNSDGVNVAGINEAGEVVTINSDSYSISSGEISVNIKDNVTTVNGITAGDKFAITGDTFIKSEAGFIKKDSDDDYYLWIDGDVTSGVVLESLTGDNDNWEAVAFAENDRITIDTNSTTAIFIDSADSLKSIYGALTKNSNGNYTLSDRKESLEANAALDLITIENVTAGLSSAFAKVDIYASGASFIVNSLTEDSALFTVDATNNSAAVLGNVSDVSLNSGTLADLTNATTVKVNKHTIAAATSSTINVGLNDALITMSELDDSEGFTFDGTNYTYKNVGVVKDSTSLYISSDLGGAVTDSVLSNGEFLTMTASEDGKTLALQRGKDDIVFVDKADDSVSAIYARQDFSDKLYTFTQLVKGEYIIDAASLQSNYGIRAAFEAQVLTPETGTYTINGKSYTALNSLTVDTTANSSTLNKGIASLKSGASVAMTNQSTIAVESGNGIQVTATSETYTLGGLNKSDTFTIADNSGEYTYSMLSDNYLFRTKDDTTELCTVSVAGSALSAMIIADDNYWNSYVILGNNGVLNLSDSSIADGTVIKYDYSTIYANLDVTGTNNFTLEKIAGASTADIKTVSLGSDDSTLTVDFATTVRSASGSSTYTINDASYTALDSALVFVTDNNDSSIKSGVITLDDSTIKTASGHTVSGSVAQIDVEKMRFTPEEGQTFTVDDGTYTLNKVGLTKDDAYVWLKTATSYDMPPDDDDWANMLVLNNTTLDLQSGAPSSINIVVDNDRTARLASLVAGDNEFTLNGINNRGEGVSSVVLGDATDTILTLAADFVTTVTTGNGQYKINKINYNGNGLEITTSKNSSALYSGTVTLSAGTDFNTVSDSDNTYKATNGTITATATDGTITNLGLLNRLDRFTIGNNYYKVLGSNSNTLFQTSSDDGTATKIYKGLIASGALNTSDIVDANFVDFIQLGASGVLDLTELYGASGWSGIVVGADSEGDYTARIAQVSYDGTGYTLGTTPYSSSSSLKSVSLDSAVQTFTTSIGTTVNTAATSTYTINGLPFNAQGALKIAAAANGTVATLIDGTVTLEEGIEVTTAQTDNVIKSTNGTITVTADEDSNTVTISGLNAGETFTFGGTSYTMTPIGLLYESDSGNRLNPNVVTDGNSIVTTDLDLSNTDIWLTLLQADGGALELTSNTSSNVVVVDMTSSTQAVKYGTLTKSGNLYTLTQGDNDATLASISMTGVRATFGAKASEVPITANTSTTFSVTTTGDFTINATSTPVITDNSEDNLLTGVVLSAGTIQAPENIPVTAGSHEITATSGTMTVSYTDSIVSIGGLDSEETFTVDGKAYKVMTVGKLFDVTDEDNPLEVTAGFASKTFTPDNLESVAVLAVSDNALDISKQTADAYIYDSLTNPTTKYATLTVTEGRYKTLAAEGNEASAIQSVSIAANDILTVDFATQIESPIGSVTVNGQTYAGTTKLLIDSDGTTSTLNEGTITLSALNTTATDSSNNTLTRQAGTFTATAANGKFTTLTGLDNAESFTYGGTTYTQNIPGLINTASSEIYSDIVAGVTINLADLSVADNWSKFTAPVDGVLDISGLTTKHIIYDNATTPTTKYATLTIVDGVKTLVGETGAATSITTVNIAAGDSLTVDFVTRIDSAAGTVTVNGNTYAGTTELLIDSDGKISTLYNGTITLDSTNTSATDSSNNTLTREAGTFTATAVDGAFTTINGLNNTESFTYGGKTYVQSAQGLRNGSVINRALTGTTINLADLDGTWDNILAPTNGVLDISSFSGNAYVYDSATNPTTQLATLTTADGVKTLTNSNNAAGSISTVNIAAGDNLVVNFATNANAPIGTVTVNNKNYVGTTELVITSDGTTSTLTDGTITLAATAEVTTTGGAAITCTAGDGITIAVASGDSETVTFSGLNEGDAFTIGELAYRVSAVAPINSNNELWNGTDYTEGLTLEAINTADNWKPMLAVSNATLNVDSETLTDGGEVILVDSLTEPTAVYGDLSKTDGKYTLTKPTTATTNLTTLSASGVAIEIVSDYAGINLVGNDSAFSDITLTDGATSYTLDATSTTPSLSNVQSLTLTAGTIAGAVNQVVTTGNNVITPTAINGALTIGTTTLNGITTGDAFTLNDKSYVMLNTGLFNDTDNKLVTSGLDDGTLTLADIVETQLIAISSGTIDLSGAVAGDSLVVDTVESPANIYGKLNKTSNTYTLTKQADGITSITMPDANSTLTTDIAATITTPTGSNTFTINSKAYTAKESALTIASDGTTSTLTTGTISLASANATVTTTSGTTMTYTAGNDGLTVAVNDGITFSDLTAGDTFTIGENSYKVSAVGLINSGGNFWTGSDYTEGLTLEAINTADNWKPMLAVSNATLNVDGETLEDGGEVILVDSVTEPTAVYGDLSRADGKYTLTKPTAATTNLTTLNASGVAIEIVSDYAGINLVGNDSAFSDVTLTDGATSYTLDATSTTPSLSNVQSLTLTAGTIAGAVNQVVTTGNNVITPTAINGTLTIGTTTLSGITTGDAFTLNDKSYVMLNTGLFNDTDNKLVTSGLDDGTLTLASIVETQLIAISSGTLDLSGAATGDSLVVDTVESPAHIYGKLNKTSNTYTLTKQADGITSIAMPDANSTLTTDIAATITTHSGSKTFTINSKAYTAKESALTIASDGTTSTLTTGTISLASANATVTTTSGTTITYTADNDGITVAVNDGITLSDLTAGDTFTIGNNTYRVTQLGFHDDNNYLWTGADYTSGVTLDAINNSDNWTTMLAVNDATLNVDGETLEDGGEVILVDSVTEPTAVYGDLSRADGKYILTKPTAATTNLTTLNAEGVAIEIVSDYAGINLVGNDSAFSGVTLVDGATSYTLDATNTTPSLSNVQSLTLTAGTIAGAVNQVVTTGNNVITPTAINGALTIGTTTLNGITTGDAFTLNDKSYVMLNTGLFNDTDNKLVTSGLDDGTLTLASIVETQLIAISSGTLDLSGAAAGDSLVVDTVESPANIYGKLTKNSNTYTLTKQADGITSITMPDANSTLTTDIAATITTPTGSKSFTINGKVYTAKDSALTIASDRTTSTLTTGTISLASANATVTTTSGTTITYTADNDGITVAVNDGITLSDLTAGDTFTIGENSYKVSAVGLINSGGNFWTGSDYTEGITLDAINNSDNWTTMLAVNDATLNVDGETLEDGGEVILVDSVTEPTAVYGDLSRADGKYTLTKPTTATTNLTTLSAEGVAIEIVSDYAGINLVGNDSAFSDVTLTDGATSYTLDATSTTPSLSNVQSLTLTAGTIAGAVNQVVTTGNNVITPTAINGTLTIGTTTLSGITTGDAFTLNDKSYVMLNTGLFNDTDNKLVTSGLDDGTLTLASIVETQLIAISSGTLDLSGAATGDSLVVDTVESPANIYGKLTKTSNTYTLTKQADGITLIAMPDANSTLTTDIAATVTTPTGSKSFTINSKAYTAKESALTIASDGTTSTLTTGTISLASATATVTTTSGTTMTYTAGNDGLTVAVNDGITFSDLTAGDTFTIGNNTYRVTQLGFHDDNNYLWTGADYTSGVTLDAINNSDNWTRTVTATNDSLTVNDTTLTDSTTAIVIDSSTASTKTLGTLSRSGDAYTLTKGDSEKLSGITVDNTTLAIDNQLADVPVTAKGATFTVTASTPYTVDATGNTPSISDDATAIEISTGTIAATTNQTVTATPDSGETNVIGQNNGTFNIGGEAFTVADNSGSVTFSMTNGVPNKVSDLELNANVTIDGRTYTAPQDDSTLTYSDADGWYFDGYVPTKYNITIDGDGNILVDAGVKFTDVISSGRTLPEDNTIKLAADVNSIAVNVTNNGSTAIAINDKDGNELVNNLGTVADVTFDSAGVMVENTSDVAGAVFTIDNGQSFETETATIKANADDCAVGVGSGGTSLSVDKAATVDAPNNTALTLGNATYTVNGVDFTTSGTAQASITSAGVKLDLATSDAITYNNSGYDGTGSAKADISKAGGVSLTSGASVNSAAGKTFNITGTVTLDANTIDAASATDVTTKASGYAVGKDDVTISGDNDGYKVNIADGKISGLENIGNADGVTIGGLSSGTIKTDKAGAFTVGDRTFVAIGDASVTYGIENNTLATADEVDSVISGDFARGLKVNGGKLQVTGDNVSLDASTDNDRKIGGFNDKATLTTADNVVKIEPTGAGEFTFGDHIFKTDDATIAFNLNNSSVTGVDSLENGNLIISQDENNFGVNDESIDLAELDAPVTLEIANSKIQSVYGLHSGMDGIDNATVYGLSAATVNGVYFEIAGGSVDLVVVDGVPVSLYGLESDMTVNSASSIAARTTENGTFQFVDDIYHINDTLDGIVVFDTDGDTHVINIGEFEGSVSGNLKDLNLNDKPFNSSSDKVTVANDGTDILKLGGLSSGDSISGSLSKATYVMPEGTLNVNDRGYILQGDDNGVSMTGDGMEVVGLDIDASLTVAKGGAYSVNGQSFNAKDGDTFIAGRDGVYIADPNNKIITEKTKIDDIIQNLLGKQEDGTVSLSGDSAASVIASGNLDSPMALTLDNSNGTGTQTADFSNSQYSKRVTLLGGDQNIKFNDEGRNSAYVDKTARGKKNIELGDGGDVAVNDSPYAKVSIKAGAGSDTIVNRNGASSTVDVKKNGDTTIVPTSGRVTLQNYDNNNNAKVRTYEYKNLGLGNAIKTNEIKFGNGVMTLGDAVVVFDPNASAVGGTFTNLVDYYGDEQRVGFTHKAGGVLNASISADDLILKGNYAETSSDTQKSGGSTLISGSGNDTILAGGGDYINAGAGENQIYITDSSLNDAGATIVLAAKGKNTVHNFNDGYDTGDAILVSDLSALDFTFGDEGLVMRSGKAQITFEGLEPAEDLITYSDDLTAAPYEIKLTDGRATYNAAVAQEDKDIGIGDNSDANIFYGNKKGSGLNFSEYSGAVEVNLNSGAGSVNGTAAQFYNINKVAAGSGDSSLIGKAGAKNTLIAGTGNTSIWSNAGRDLMVGNTSEDKNGSTMFYYLAGDGHDTITNFNFATLATDNSDIINITAANAVTNVYLRGDNVVMQINNSDSDYLTLVDAKGKDFKINNLIAKVDVNADFDNVANCYVADSNNATMSVGADLGDAQVWLDDRVTGQHGVYYLGEIKYLDARTANGNSTLVGNDLDNIIYGGEGSNSIWGGFGANNDTLIGGNGHNVFFFGMQNGNDIIQNAKAGDVIDLTTITLEQVASTTVNGGGAKIGLVDGSSLEIQGTADVEYRFSDGSRYKADHNSGQWKSNA